MPSRLAAKAMPQEIGNPCPSEPVETSIPGAPRVAWPASFAPLT